VSENTLAWTRIPPRLGENTHESTLAPGTFSPGRLYPHWGETTFSPMRKQSREHTCCSKPFSPGRDAVAWANYAENITYQIIHTVFTTTGLLHMPQMTNLSKNLTCIPLISTFSSCIQE